MESYWLETDIDNEVGIVFEILLAEAWDRQRGRYVLFFESYWLEPGIDNEVGIVLGILLAGAWYRQ